MRYGLLICLLAPAVFAQSAYKAPRRRGVFRISEDITSTSSRRLWSGRQIWAPRNSTLLKKWPRGMPPPPLVRLPQSQRKPALEPPYIMISTNSGWMPALPARSTATGLRSS